MWCAYPSHRGLYVTPLCEGDCPCLLSHVIHVAQPHAAAMVYAQCGSLPIALAARGHRVMVVSPQYSDFGAEQSEVRRQTCPCSATPCFFRQLIFCCCTALQQNHRAPMKPNVLRCLTIAANQQVKIPAMGTEAGLTFIQRNSVDFVFVSHPAYMRQGLYSDTHGVYGDNQARNRLKCPVCWMPPHVCAHCVFTGAAGGSADAPSWQLHADHAAVGSLTPWHQTISSRP